MKQTLAWYMKDKALLLATSLVLVAFIALGLRLAGNNFLLITDTVLVYALCIESSHRRKQLVELQRRVAEVRDRE